MKESDGTSLLVFAVPIVRMSESAASDRKGQEPSPSRQCDPQQQPRTAPELLLLHQVDAPKRRRCVFPID